MTRGGRFRRSVHSIMNIGIHTDIGILTVKSHSPMLLICCKARASTSPQCRRAAPIAMMITESQNVNQCSKCQLYATGGLTKELTCEDLEHLASKIYD